MRLPSAVLNAICGWIGSSVNSFAGFTVLYANSLWIRCTRSCFSASTTRSRLSDGERRGLPAASGCFVAG